MSSNQSSSCYCISRSNKEFYSQGNFVNILNTPSIWSICFLTASTFQDFIPCTWFLEYSGVKFFPSFFWDVWYASQHSVGLLSFSRVLLLFHLLPNWSTHLMMMFQEPSQHCFVLIVFHQIEVISHQSQINLMTSLHQVYLHSNPHWLTSSSLNLLDCPLYITIWYCNVHPRGHWESRLLLLICIFQQYHNNLN